MRDPKTSSTNKVATYSKQGVFGPPKPGNFEVDEKTSSRVQCKYCKMEIVMCTTFSVCGAEQPNLLKENEEQAQTSLQAGFAHIQSLTQLEIRPRKLKGNTYGQRRAQPHWQRQDHCRKGVTKGVNIGNTEEKKEVQFLCRKIGYGHNLSRKSLIRTPSTKMLRCLEKKADKKQTYTGGDWKK